MRVVQALHWMPDMLAQESERTRIHTELRRLLDDPKHGEAIREDLRAGGPTPLVNLHAETQAEAARERRVRRTVLMSTLSVRRGQLYLLDTCRNIDARLPFDCEGLQREGLFCTANENVRAKSETSGHFCVHSLVLPGEQAVLPGQGCGNDRPDEMSFLYLAKLDSILVNRSGVVFDRAVTAREIAGHRLLAREYFANAYRSVALKNSDPGIYRPGRNGRGEQNCRSG